MCRGSLALLTVLVGSLACQDNSIVEPDPALAAEMGRVAADVDPILVEVPFHAEVSVWDHSDYTDTRCGGYPVFFLTMEGSGTATHLGSITTRMTFCCNVATGEYWGTQGSFVAANGDELFLEIPGGQILLNTGDDADYYRTMFNDPGLFTGGTGRFEGATGAWETNAYVHDDSDGDGPDTWRTDFSPTGRLILQNGVR